MEYIYNAFVDNDDILLARKQKCTINVRFCRTCPFFQHTFTVHPHYFYYAGSFALSPSENSSQDIR